jgi:hypothetical protein
MTPRVPHRVTGMARAAMRATLKGRSMMVTIITDIIANRNS